MGLSVDSFSDADCQSDSIDGPRSFFNWAFSHTGDEYFASCIFNDTLLELKFIN